MIEQQQQQLSHFDEFFIERRRIKRELYTNVLFYSLLFALIWGILNLVCMLPVKIIDGFEPYSTTRNCMLLVSSTFRIVGACAYSTIPTDEVDVAKYLGESALFRYLFLSQIGLLLFSLGTLALLTTSDAGIQFFSCALCYFAGVFMFSILFLKVKYEYLVISLVLFIMSISICGPTFSLAYNHPFNWYQGTLIIVAFLTQLYVVYIDYSRGYFTGLTPFCSNLAGPSQAPVGWGATLFNKMIYICFIEYGIDMVIAGLCYYVEGNSIYSIDIAVGCLDLVPMFVVFILTPRRCFTLLARYFEYSVNRLLNDGAVLAVLVKNNRSLDEVNNIYWVYRKNPADEVSSQEDSNLISQQFYMKGTFEHHSSSIAINVSFDDDQNKWKARFDGCQVIISDVSSTALRQSTSDRKSKFTNWKSSNFLSSNPNLSIAKVDYELLQVQLVLKLEQSDEQILNFDTAVNEFLKCATKRIRKYVWNTISVYDDLLNKSPRAMGDDNIKEKVYNMSEQVDIRSNADKIDYFVSHSWTDDPILKTAALNTFSEKFRTHHKRYPSFWLDKVCIDQKNPGDGIAALPVNIAACKQVLVLMGTTYLSRLWCLWELFTLFTFCNKELAVERVEIISIGHFNFLDLIKSFKGNVANFINNSHCFDPNEEFRLRHIMLRVIGADRLQNCLDVLSELEKMGRVYSLEEKATTTASTTLSCVTDLSEDDRKFTLVEAENDHYYFKRLVESSWLTDLFVCKKCEHINDGNSKSIYETELLSVSRIEDGSSL